ncbi:MAG TPA: hypothetical protein P5084_02610 [Paludibacter sp.]|nr:hypothetical protein [Paludibacter sp.]
MNFINRPYKCKNEEVLPVAKFTFYSVKRDLADFSAFSSVFNEQYVTETEAKINAAENLLEPKAETLTLRLINQAMEQQGTDLNKLLLKIDGYLRLMRKETGITATAFGVSALRRSLNRGDYEGVLKGLKVLMSNVQNQLTMLQSKGMPATMPQTLQDIHNSLAVNKQKQFEIKSNRAAIVQDNQQLLNDLFMRMAEIYNIGKVLYKNTDPAKYRDYTFTALLKKVRNTSPQTPLLEERGITSPTSLPEQPAAPTEVAK